MKKNDQSFSDWNGEELKITERPKFKPNRHGKEAWTERKRVQMLQKQTNIAYHYP